jgi:microcystin-dependent protein
MSEPFLGQITMFAGNFNPRGWAFCDGQLLPISQYSALFSLLGTTYGGDGRTTFGLPDLRGRVPMHAGSGPGLTPRPLGQKSGSEAVQLTVNQIPSHNHVVRCNDSDNDETSPVGGVPGPAPDDFYAETPNADMNQNSTTATGGGQPHSNIQPFQVVNFIIALQGVYPSRN